MNFILRKFVLAPVILAAAALTANSAMAAATVKVPFSFTANGEECPAGYYSVDRGIHGHIVTLRSQKTTQAFSWLIGPGNPGPTETKVSLKFDQYGSTHTLQSVQFGSDITSRLDKNSKIAERVSLRNGQGQ